MSESRVNIVGVGNTLMGDDGVGPAAVQAMAARDDLPAAANLYDAGLALSDVLGGLDPDEALIVVDAVRAGGAPGAAYRFAVDDLWADGAGPGGGLSLHEISVVPALRIEAVTDRAFSDVTVFGVEPGEVACGVELSPPVAGALETLIDAVFRHVRHNPSVAPTAGEPA